ncbi:MAG: tetratricopeptide repeat protein, partial [Bacteroidales bacterium]
IDYSYFIERYIAGEMNQAENDWFKKELEGNDALKREIELRRKTDNALSRHELIDLRNKLAEIEKVRKEKKVLRIAQKKSVLRSAAVLASFILLGSMFLIINRNPSTDFLYRKNFVVYYPGGAVRNSVNASNTNDALYKEALIFYNQSNFESASGLLREYLTNIPGHMEAHLVYGISAMKNNDFTEAEKSFSVIIHDGNNLYMDNARWYLALCYLRTDNIEAAKMELETIKDSKSIYSSRAEKILRKIK